MAARKKDVRRERVVFRFHCCKLRLNIAYRRNQTLQNVFKACGTHHRSIEHIAAKRQAHGLVFFGECRWGLESF
jgi:hypothetical protein